MLTPLPNLIYIYKKTITSADLYCVCVCVRWAVVIITFTIWHFNGFSIVCECYSYTFNLIRLLAFAPLYRTRALWQNKSNGLTEFDFFFCIRWSTWDASKVDSISGFNASTHRTIDLWVYRIILRQLKPIVHHLLGVHFIFYLN